MKSLLFFALVLTSCSSHDLTHFLPDLPSLKEQRIKQQSIEEQAVKQAVAIDSAFFNIAEEAVWKINNYLELDHNEITINYSQENKPVTMDIQNTTQTIGLKKGTGFFINPKHIGLKQTKSKYLITNFHVIYNHLNQHTKIIASKKSPDGVIFNKLKLLKVSAIYDLALLESETPVKHYLSIENRNTYSKKDSFFLIAYPKNLFIRAPLIFHNSYFDSHLLSFQKKVRLDSAGASGGPIINKKGNVIAVNWAGNELFISSISNKALNHFLDESNRDCSPLSSEDCISKEWLFLEKLSKKEDKLSQYILSSGLNLSQWQEKKQLLKNLTEHKQKLTETEINLTKAFNQLHNNSEDKYLSKLKDALEEYEAAVENYNDSVSLFNTSLRKKED